jgi:hypothetical protein
VGKNLPEIPFTEICERVSEITRTPGNSISKIRGDVNEVYTVEIPVKFDWNFLFASTSLITNAEYATGSVTVTTDSTTVVFSSDTVLTAAMTGRKIKISGNDVVYEFTFSNTTGGTINPSFQGPNNVSGGSFSIFQNVYALPTNFDRFPKNGGIYKWSGGKKDVIEEESYQEASSFFQSSPTDNPAKVRLVGTDTAGRQLVEFRPPPKSSRVYGCDYLKKVNPLSETTAGSVTINASGTTVTGDTNCRFSEASAGDYLRINDFGTSQDSTWYRIATITHNSSLTLSGAFATSGVISAEYTISKVPEFPAKLHPGLVYGASRLVTADQNDPNLPLHIARFAEVLSDGKRVYVTRVYNQQIGTIAEEFRYRV